MNQNLTELLTRRIQAVYPFNAEKAHTKAEALLADCPLFLLPNVEEWAGERPLSPLKVSTYSVDIIMMIWGTPDFLEAMDVMIQMYQGEEMTALCRIWRGRR